MKMIEEKEEDSGGEEESPPKHVEEEKKKDPSTAPKIKKAITPLFSLDPDEDTDTPLPDGELKVAEVKNSELV